MFLKIDAPNTWSESILYLGRYLALIQKTQDFSELLLASKTLYPHIFICLWQERFADSQEGAWVTLFNQNNKQGKRGHLKQFWTTLR